MADDPINPQHYRGVEIWGLCIELGFDLGTAVKYLKRAGKKDSTTYVEDLTKAKRYIDHAIEVHNAGK